MSGIEITAHTTHCAAGSLTLLVSRNGLRAVLFGKHGRASSTDNPEAQLHLDSTLRWLRNHETGAHPNPLPTLDIAGTDFQLAVWNRLARLDPGLTVSYAELARMLGRAGAARAVGAAVGRNPVPVLIPCHRVLAAGGALGGFGGGLALKRALLDHEHLSYGPPKGPSLLA